MGRFFNREAGFVAVALLAAGLGIGLAAGLAPWLVAAVTVGLVALAHWPLTIAFQSWILEFYVERGRLDRALHLAIEIRDSAMTRSEREKAVLDVAFVHLARSDYEHALQNLQRVIGTSLKPATKAVVDATPGYSLAHLGRELERAEKLIESAIRATPKEPLFTYFLGLLRFRQNRFAEARELINRSLVEEPDPKLPYPGERGYILAQVLKNLGDTAGAREALQKARSAGGRFGGLAARELENQAA
jgi:tetratricopeptide (TPR) repeat protein